MNGETWQKVTWSPAAYSIAVSDIYDQTYHLRGSDQEYIQRLAAMVDSKMRAVAANGNTVDSLRVAVLAALNIADELVRLEENYRRLSGTVSETQYHLCTRAPTASPACWTPCSPKNAVR